jgi:hypothetical protein
MNIRLKDPDSAITSSILASVATIKEYLSIRHTLRLSLEAYEYIAFPLAHPGVLLPKALS